MARENKESSFGPGFLVTAAFIGPGTVTACSLAGANFGYSLLFTLIFATLTTIILQEMTGRLSLSSRLDLAQSIREFPKKQVTKISFTLLTLFSITLGCAAYEAGNIIGGSLGLEMVTSIPKKYWVILISITAVIILSLKKYRIIEKFLVFLVFLMSISFITTAIIVRPNLSDVLKGLVPKFPENSLLIILALIGTTVVPYNLFLHSSAVKTKWKTTAHLKTMRKDLFLSVSLGGIISASIIVTSATTFFYANNPLKEGTQLALQLKPLLASSANLLFGLGFFAAGLSSALTAPYAAAFASSGVLGWKKGQNSQGFRGVWLAVIIAGFAVSLLDLKPLAVILFAQVANGLILPIASVFLLFILNNRQKMKSLTNTSLQNILGILVILIVSIIGIWNIIKNFM